MLLAYIDEIGETGAFISREDPKFNTSPAFGYAGFIIPQENARQFGAIFAGDKGRLFKSEIEKASDPGQWERKGSDIFRPDTPTKFPQQLRVFNGLVNHVKRLGGHLFFYADEKPLGTPKQVDVNPVDREAASMRETLNRIARHADAHESNVMVVMDQITEKTRAERLPLMYGHIYARAAEHVEMRRIIEPPMHVDSKLSANIQFADWVAACVSRAIDYQLLEGSKYEWITRRAKIPALHGSFTHESKLHLHQRAVKDLNNYDVFHTARALKLPASGVAEAAPADFWRRIKAGAEKAHAEKAASERLI